MARGALQCCRSVAACIMRNMDLKTHSSQEPGSRTCSLLSAFLAALICPSALLSPLPPTSQLLSSSCFLSCETAGLSQPRGCCQADSGIPASAGTAPGSQGCGPEYPLLLRSQRAQGVTQDLGPRHSWHHSGVGREQVGLLEDQPQPCVCSCQAGPAVANTVRVRSGAGACSLETGCQVQGGHGQGLSPFCRLPITALCYLYKALLPGTSSPLLTGSKKKKNKNKQPTPARPFVGLSAVGLGRRVGTRHRRVPPRSCSLLVQPKKGRVDPPQPFVWINHRLPLITSHCHCDTFWKMMALSLRDSNVIPLPGPVISLWPRWKQLQRHLEFLKTRNSKMTITVWLRQPWLRRQPSGTQAIPASLGLAFSSHLWRVPEGWC